MKSLVLALILMVLAAQAQAQAQASAFRCEQLFGYRPIEIKNSNLILNNFATARNLTSYEKAFPFTHARSVGQAVFDLPLDATWIDMGAGEARAIEDGLVLNRRMKAVAISYVRPGKSFDGAGAGERFKYLDGDFVENMAAKGRLDDYLGRVALITDVYGPFSYTSDLPLLMQTYLNLLAKGGSAYINVMTERHFGAAGSGRAEAMNPVQLEAARYSTAGLLEWLRTIPGIEIVDAAKASLVDEKIQEYAVAFKIRKIVEHVDVPNNLEMTSYTADSPPVRKFRLRN